MDPVIKLVRALNDAKPYPGDSLRLLFGEVTETSPLTVDINGGTVEEPDRHGGYTPTVGDVVWCLSQGTTLLVCGRVVD